MLNIIVSTHKQYKIINAIFRMLLFLSLKCLVHILYFQHIAFGLVTFQVLRSRPWPLWLEQPECGVT